MASDAARAMYPSLAAKEPGELPTRSADPAGKPTWATSSDPMWSKTQHDRVVIPDQWLAKIGLIKVRK